MYRHPRPFAATSTFQPAYRILSPSGDTSCQDPTPFHNPSPSPSHTRHRLPPPTTGVDDEIDSEAGQPPRLRWNALNAEAATEMSRASWEHGEPASVAVPLLPLGSSLSPRSRGNGKSGPSGGLQGQSHTLLSRTPLPYPGAEEDSAGAAGIVGGKLGWRLWNTQRGWINLVTLMAAWNIGSGVLLVFMNQVILRFGVYKYVFFFFFFLSLSLCSFITSFDW